MQQDFTLHCELDAPIEAVWDALQQPALLNHIAAPLLRFRAIEPDHWPERWQPGPYRAAMLLFGVLPIGWQVIDIALPPAGPDGVHHLHDNGHSPLFKRWQHRITLEPCAGGTRYTDRISADAGMLTPLVMPFVRLFFRHRQRRWRALIARGLGGFASA